MKRAPKVLGVLLVGRRRAHLACPVDANQLVAAILLRLAGLDALVTDAELEPPG